MSLSFEDTNFMVEDLWQKFDLFEEAENAVKFFSEGSSENSYEEWDAGSLDGESLLNNCDKDILTGAFFEEEINADKFLLRDCMWSGRCIDDTNIVKTTNVAIKKENGAAEIKRPQTISKSDSLLLNNIKKTCNEQRINTNKSQMKSMQPGRSLLIRSRNNSNLNTNKQTSTTSTTNLLPVNQGFNSLNLLQVLKQVEDGDTFDGIDKKFNMFPSPPDSSEENDNDDCENNKFKTMAKNGRNNLNDFLNTKIKQEIDENTVKKEKTDDFDLFNNKKLFSLSDSEDSNLDFDNDMFSDTESFTFKPFHGFDDIKIKKEIDSDEYIFNNKFKTKIKSEPISPAKSESRFKQEPRIVRNNPCETDHCYSLPKHESVREKSLDRNLIGMLGVQTPSDSEEEEIDVVSLGVSHNQFDTTYYSCNYSGKANLPTCPSKQDRKQLQLEVNRKISESNNRIQKDISVRKPNAIPESQIVKQPGGLKTLVPRSRPSYNNSSRDDSDDDYEVHASKSRSTGSKLNRKRKRDKSASSDDEFDTDYHLSQFSSSTNESSTSSSQHKPQKKRGRKRRCDDDNIWNTHNGVERSSRSAHNDMERRRRVGLRVLFEELRQVIPQLSSKEKAPKVSILREASALCRELRERDEEMKREKREQKRLLERVRELRRELAFSRA